MYAGLSEYLTEQMIIDFEETSSTDSLSADVCIVGAGAVGIAMAVALDARGIDVLLVEGGGTTLEKRSQDLHQGESVGHPFESIGVGRYRVFGGSTTYWGGQVLPFDPFVTGARPWIGHDAWPMSSDELSHFYGETYRLLGLDDAIQDDMEVWRRLGQSIPNLGADIDLVMTRWVKTRNFARRFGTQLRKSGSVRVLVHANVTAVEMNPERSRVTSLRIQSLSGKSARVSGRQFVLANGTLEIVRLLKHPLADGAPAPWAESPWLGAPLIDHLDCTVGDVKVIDYERFHAMFDNIYFRGYKYYPKMRLAPQAQERDGLVDVAAQFLYRTRFTEHLEYLKMFLRSLREGGLPIAWTQLPQHALAVLQTAAPLAVRYFRDRRSFKPSDAEVSLVLNCEQLPNKQSCIELSDDRDALGMRRLRVRWAIGGRELETFRAFSRSISTGLERAQLAQVRIDERLQDLDPSFLEGVHDAVHQMGTTRVGSSSSDGFVDSNLTVFGVENMYLAGATVFPSTGFANPTFTAIALALRLCNWLEGRLERVD